MGPAVPAAGLLLLALALARAAPPGAPGQGPSFDREALLRQLAVADQAWIPRAEPLPGGGIRYVYKRRSGEPELSLAQVRALIQAPPSLQRERQAIRSLLAELERAGVRIDLAQPRKPGAAAEWDATRQTIRIQSRVVALGSRDFALVLNHESLHVAQSCRGRGRAGDPPRPLGLDQRLPSSLAAVLAEPVYRQASPREQQLEREAYAHQENLSLGPALVRRYCRPA